MPIGSLLLAIAAALYGLYEMGVGWYAYRRSGFNFYLSAGLLIGLPALVVCAYLFLGLDRHPTGWEPVIFVVWAFGFGWKVWNEKNARRDHPVEWRRWEDILNENKTKR